MTGRDTRSEILEAPENEMDATPDPSSIEGLQENIRTFCRGLEQSGQESLLITVSGDGHLVFGSEKGKKFLEDRYDVIADFIQYCADSGPAVKAEDEGDKDLLQVIEPDLSTDSLKESQTAKVAVHEFTDDSKSIDEVHLDDLDSETDDLEELAAENDKEDSDYCPEQEEEQIRPKKRKMNLCKKKDTRTLPKNSKQNMRITRNTPNNLNASDKTDKLNDDKVVSTRLRSGKKLDNTEVLSKKLDKAEVKSKHLDQTEVKKNQVKTKSVISCEKREFVCDKCGFVFKFETHLTEHNQRNPDCKPVNTKNPVSSEEKDENILHSEVSIKDPVSGEMRTKTIRELLNQTEAPFTCEVCSKTFDRFHKLKRHVFPHANIRPYQCNICCQSFNMEEMLRQHTRMHNCRPFHCTKCLSRHVSQEKLDGHVVLCTAKHFLICAICDYKASSVNDLITHKRTHPKMRDGKRTNCNICGKELNNTYSVVRHKQSFHNDDYPHECKICGKKYKVELTLRRHLVTHGDPIYHCKLCDYSCYLSANLKLHMITHTKERPFVCDFCGKQYRAKNLLDNHRRLHTGEKPYTCDFEGCGKAFRSLMTLKQHKCCHATSYAFICDFCGKSFKVKSALRHHRKDHTIEWRWPCPYCEEKFKSCDRYKTHVAKSHPEKIQEIQGSSNIKFYPCSQCDRVLIDIEDFREHMNVHTGNRPHKCRYCGKGFSSRKNMRQHEKSHTGEQKLRCRFCPKKYSDPNALKVHLSNRHDIEMLEMDTISEMTLPDKKNKTKKENQSASIKESQSAVNSIFKKEEEDASRNQKAPPISQIPTADSTIHPVLPDYKVFMYTPGNTPEIQEITINP